MNAHRKLYTAYKAGAGILLCAEEAKDLVEAFPEILAKAEQEIRQEAKAKNCERFGGTHFYSDPGKAGYCIVCGLERERGTHA